MTENFQRKILFYIAPMEGLTGYVFRNAYDKYFHNADKYFTPFISSTGLSHRELHDILPENNEGMQVVPQILTNKAEDFLIIAGKLKDYGYTCVNLNLGCPSGTVVRRKRGAGFLSDPDALERFLEEVFEKCPLSVSVKTRLGVTDTDEWERLQEIFNRFPLEELIIHPRVQKDFYKNPLHLDIIGNMGLSRRTDSGGHQDIKEDQKSRIHRRVPCGCKRSLSAVGRVMQRAGIS